MATDTNNLVSRVTVNYSMPQTADYLSDPDHARSHRIVAVNHSAPAASIGIDGDGNAIFSGKVIINQDIGIVADTDAIQITAANKIKFNSLIFSVGSNAPEESWSTSYTVIELGGNTAFMADVGAGAGKTAYFMQNAYYDGAWKYQDTDEATLYAHGGGGIHQFFVAASGTADAAITWVRGLRISNAANLHVGPNAPEESWSTSYTVLELGADASFMGTAAAGGGGSLNLSQNAYFDGAWKYQDTGAASNHYMTGGTHVFRVAASGTADTAISWTTAMIIDNSARAAVGVAINTSIRLFAQAPDAQATITTAVWGQTYSDGTNNQGVYGQSLGGGGTNNYGVFGQAANAGTRNDHFRSADGDNCSGGAWNDSCHSSRKRLIRKLNPDEDAQLYALLPTLNIKAYRHLAEIPIVDYDEENKIVNEIGQEVPTPIYDNASVAPERYGLMADDPDLPAFLKNKNRETLSAGRRVSYMEICVQYQAKLIKQLQQEVAILKGV